MAEKLAVARRIDPDQHGWLDECDTAEYASIAPWDYSMIGCLLGKSKPGEIARNASSIKQFQEQYREERGYNPSPSLWKGLCK